MVVERGNEPTKVSQIFKVSKRLVQFTCMPEKLAKNKADREERGGWKQYYVGGEEWAETMKKHRRYKHNILKDTI